MGHRCCNKQKVKRGLWSPEEDDKLVNYITTHGHASWSSVPKLAGLQRCGKSCRLRWINYLRPDLRRGSFSEEEERTIIEVHRILGNRWAQIAKHLPGRTDNEVKNFWNSCIKKKLLAQGLDPNTHNLLPSHQKNIKNNNKTSKTTTHHRIQSNSSSLDFSVDHNQDSIHHLNSIDPQNINFCWDSKDTQTKNVISEFSTQCLDHMSSINPCGYNMVDESSIWSCTSLENFEQQPVRTQVTETQQENICVMENLHVTPNFEGSFNSPGFEFGFGDYCSLVAPSSLYGDMGSAMDQVAWGDC